MIETTMTKFMFLLTIRAVKFCVVREDLLIVPCVEAYVECVLDDNEQWCRDNIMYFYQGK